MKRAAQKTRQTEVIGHLSLLTKRAAQKDDKLKFVGHLSLLMKRAAQKDDKLKFVGRLSLLTKRAAQKRRQTEVYRTIVAVDETYCSESDHCFLFSSSSHCLSGAK
jgi:hypothetical protein